MVAAETVATLFEGIADLGVLPSIDAVLSGYIGTAETGAVLLDIVQRRKTANPKALFCYDPVIGDTDTGSYVLMGSPSSFAMRRWRWAASCTALRARIPDRPNRHDLGGGRGCGNGLRERGPSTVLLTQPRPCART